MASTFSGWWRRGRARKVPFVRFVLYYVVLVAVAAAAALYFPSVRQAFIAPITVSQERVDLYLGGGSSGAAAPSGGTAPSGGGAATPAVQPPPAGVGNGVLQRALTTVLITLGAILLVLPVAWVYMFTRRLRYNPSLAQSIVLLPPVVAGVVILVKNSLALAFSLAGIVAAVRFRNTLKDPKDAVFIFLVLGIGLAAGVQALDVALIASFTFNLLVLVLWKYSMAGIYSGVSGQQAALSIGDRALAVVTSGAAREREIERVARSQPEMEPDGLLIVHSRMPSAARRGIEVTLERLAKEWHFIEGPEAEGDVTTLRALVRLRKKTDPAMLLGELDDQAAPYVATAEYVTIGVPEEEEEEDE